MFHLAVAPDYLDDKEMEKYRRALKVWDKKLDRCDDEVLIYIRERINYLLEVRSQNYLAEMESDENKTTN